MPKRGPLAVALAVVVASLALVACGGAAAAPLLKATNGNKVEVVATGVPTPTAFAFAGSTVFAGSGPAQPTEAPGGLFTLAGGVATKVPGSPPNVFGLAWKSNTLYVSTGPTIVAFSGWNGTSFSSSTTIYASERQGFSGFNGLAFGPDGRLYAGLALEENSYDHAKDPFSPSQAVVSMTASGQDFKVVAKGLRQPFQLNFPQGSKYPYVTVLLQDRGKLPIPSDEIVLAKPGQNYGFPTCGWLATEKNRCKRFDEPAIFLPPHASPMGIGSIGSTLYVALFVGTGKGPEVTSISAKGKRQPFLTGFPAPAIALGVNKGSVYVGDLTGTIYRVAAK